VRELYLAVEDIYHSRTKTKCPHTNGICERFNKAVLPDFLGHDSSGWWRSRRHGAGRSRVA
jgi:hypothetical protein